MMKLTSVIVLVLVAALTFSGVSLSADAAEPDRFGQRGGGSRGP